MIDIKIIEEGLTKYLRMTLDRIIDRAENLYGGPKEWPKGICGHPDNDEDGAVEIWNTAISAVVEIIKEHREV